MVVLCDRCSPGKKTCCIDLGLILSKLELGVLECADRSAELSTLLNVYLSLVDRTLRKTYGLCSDTDTAAVQSHHGDLEALILLTKESVLRNTDFVIGNDTVLSCADTHTLDVVADGDARHLLQVNDECGKALGDRYASVSDSENNAGISKTGVGREDLGSVDDIAVVLFNSDGLSALNVGTCVGLGQAEAADLGAVNQRTKILLLLVLGTKLIDTGAGRVVCTPKPVPSPTRSSSPQTAHRAHSYGVVRRAPVR